MPGGVPGDRVGTIAQTSVSEAIDYRIHLREPAQATVALSGMTRDFNCGLSFETAGGEDPPPAAVSGTDKTRNCTNRSGAADDSWTGLLPAGQSKLTVSPAGKLAGDYTLTVTLKPVRTLPFTVAESAVGGDRDFLFALATKSQVKVSLTGMDRDIDCRVNGRSCTNRGGARDDSWSGTLDGGVHKVRVYPFGGGRGAYTLRVAATTADPPAAPALTGKVSGTLQSLAWTKAASTIPLTRNQLQVRESVAQGWYFTVSGTPSPSHDLAADAAAWSFTTPAGMTLEYRVRASNAGGDGAWSSVVKLTSGAAAPQPSPDPPAPPPTPPPTTNPLSLPAIPNFRVPSGGLVNTPFPPATGGTSPYSYGLRGLPPGISFNAATRVASGTLPTVTRDTTYVITYSATDSAALSTSVTFTSTVLPPPPPPPPPLTLPGIPNFRVPARGVVNTPFPAATGGIGPYAYSLSGLPPGISFDPSTRLASGTLPAVARETTYTIVYAVTDSVGASASVTFTTTVVPRR